MSPRFLEACQSLQPAEKATWDILLRELPDAEVLPHEIVDTAMNQTLDQLWRLLRAGPAEEGLQHATATPLPLPADSECPLTTHLPYFNAGERALELILQEVNDADPALRSSKYDADREELCSAYNVLVQCQLEAVCRHCGRAGQCRYGDLRAVAKLPASRHPFDFSSQAPAQGAAAKPKSRRGPAAKPRARRREGPDHS